MTPEWVYRAIEDQFGRPGLDPCWHPQSPVIPFDAYCLDEHWADAGKGLYVVRPKPYIATVANFKDLDYRPSVSETMDKFLVVRVGDDGLAGNWDQAAAGYVWLNPPYSDPGPWLEKAKVWHRPAVALLKFDPTTRWYDDHVRRAAGADVGIFRKRLKYGRTDGGKQHSAEFPSCLVMYNMKRPTGLELDWVERRYRESPM